MMAESIQYNTYNTIRCLHRNQMDHNKRNRVCWEIESVNDTKNNKHNCSFGKTKSFSDPLPC